MAVGTISGMVNLYRLESCVEPILLSSTDHHTESCRSICNVDEESYMTASADKSIAQVDVETAAVSWHNEGAHDAGINVLLNTGEASHPHGLIASGDDDGWLKLWDVRQERAVMNFHDHEDFISSMIVQEDKRTLVTCSGDGTIAAYNLRQGKLELRSDQLEDEHLSCAVIKAGKALVCGSQDGVLHTYKWGDWADISDRFPGHPASIDSMAVIDEDTLLTGSSDGLIRLCTVQPHKLIGVLGDHGEYPIETMVVRWENDASDNVPLPTFVGELANSTRDLLPWVLSDWGVIIRLIASISEARS
jgi:WD repeat-containing protein 55